jgi:hypothetical protein
METATRQALIDHAIRWSNNMITEVLGNHGMVLSAKKRAKVRAIIEALGNYLQPDGLDDNG